ncbi:FAD-dependent oxidoreductase [Kineosporia rhizophila]|uniref:FAD/NAD(P)-dependent oxidoreductase n=1 Tax=Kineosporia rhizophila TaxID=84633 RepID=UPI001E36628B|nr:NAD(P)/FAD-dependent oxidoreductase [Kineosporia rhizophila]MCE0536557.1 FAD-dependent oxidoreductase [Kineosporia rhizophila]
MTEKVLIIGGGPAGMAAAHAALAGGAEVTLLEAGDALGGQFWRHLPEARSGAAEHRLHHKWELFHELQRELLENPSCEVVLGAHVWSVERPEGSAAPAVHVMVGPADGTDREPRTYRPDHLVLATGGQERTLPFPGWDLPGVFTAGAAQALAKGERVAVGRRVLVAGAGPFLLPVVTSLIHTGATVVGVAEASGWRTLGRGWLSKPWELAATRSKAGELTGYVSALARHRVPYHAATTVVAAHGQEQVEAVTLARLDADWNPVPGTERRVEVDAVCVSHGFVARTELALSIGCAVGESGFVQTDPEQRTSVAGVFCVGELTGIGGVDLALAEGEIAGTVAAGGEPDPAVVRSRNDFRAFADRLQAAHGIRPGWQSWPDPETTLCRCEDVTVGQVRDVAAATQARGLRSLKLTTRVGLGPCQGRTCGRNAEEILAAAAGPEGLLESGRTANRPIAVPVRLGELASSQNSQNHSHREEHP